MLTDLELRTGSLRGAVPIERETRSSDCLDAVKRPGFEGLQKASERVKCWMRHVENRAFKGFNLIPNMNKRDAVRQLLLW